MSNTHIQILRSRNVQAPSNLVDGELAYSFVSNTLFIGAATYTGANNILKIGGQYYTNMIDSASSSDTPSTLVLRDANGSANVILTLIDGGHF
jgi:hypothetical protein